MTLRKSEGGELKKLYWQLLEDECETDTNIRKEFEKIFSKDFIYGDTTCVPPLEMLVEKAVEEILTMRIKESAGSSSETVRQ